MKMISTLSVGEIMTKKPLIIEPDKSIMECVKQMRTKKCGSALIEKNSKLLGVVTEKDILKAVWEKKDIEKTKVREIMSSKIEMISQKKDVYEAFLRMNKRDINGLVVGDNAKIIGVLHMSDILRAEPKLFERVSKNLEEWKTEEDAEEGVCPGCLCYGQLYKVDNRLLCESCRDMIE